MYISTHAPLAGCDVLSLSFVLFVLIFQPTHPLRGATQGGRCEDHHDGISTHAPLAGCDGQECVNKMLECVISTHAPLAGCDETEKEDEDMTGEISTHAPLAGCDGRTPMCMCRSYNFNPRTPCGVRPDRDSPKCQIPRFQPTHPLRGATKSPLPLT